MLPWTSLLVNLGLMGCAGDSVEEGRGLPDFKDSAEDALTSPSRLRFEGPKPRNLLLLSVDTLRRDKVGRYGGGHLTPFLDGLLEQSVVLDDFRSCSNWTFSSMLCALTGRTTVDLGFEPAGRRPEGAVEEEGSQVPDDLEVMPVWLSEAGYATSLVSTTRFLSSSMATGNGVQQEILDPDASADLLTPQVLGAVEPLLAGEQPWSLHVHYRDPHFPYQAPSEWVEIPEGLAESAYSLRKQDGVAQLETDWEGLSEEEQELNLAWLHAFYDAEVRFLDAELGLLWEALEGMGALEDALVVLFTDHGEQFFEHGGFQHYTDLFEEESAAVGALWARGLMPTSHEEPTSHPDLLPAIFEVLELELPKGVTGAVPGKASAGRPRHTFFGPHGVKRGPFNTIDLDGLRLYYRWSGEMFLFDRRADPEEQQDLYGTLPAQELEDHLLGVVARSSSYVSWAEPAGLPGGTEGQ